MHCEVGCVRDMTAGLLLGANSAAQPREPSSVVITAVSSNRKFRSNLATSFRFK